MACSIAYRPGLTSLLRHAASASPAVIKAAPCIIPNPKRLLSNIVKNQSNKLLEFAFDISKPARPQTSANSDLTDFNRVGSFMGGIDTEAEEEQYHLHIYSTKHNTHITFTNPKKDPIISVACGNIGFKKAQRGTYDAAYQLAAHVFTRLEDKHKLRPKNIEVVLRGFGEGREAVVKALLGTEGRHLKNSIKRVTDSTRLKFGGTRSKKPRRLG